MGRGGDRRTGAARNYQEKTVLPEKGKTFTFLPNTKLCKKVNKNIMCK